MEQVYEPRKNLALEELMFLFFGRLVFCQYIKNKWYKYGVKRNMLIDSFGIVYWVMIYSVQAHDMILPVYDYRLSIISSLCESHITSSLHYNPKHK